LAQSVTRCAGVSRKTGASIWADQNKRWCTGPVSIGAAVDAMSRCCQAGVMRASRCHEGNRCLGRSGTDQSRKRINTLVTVGAAVGKVGALPQHSVAADPDVKPLGSNQLNAALVGAVKEPGLMGVGPGLLHHSLSFKQHVINDNYDNNINNNNNNNNDGDDGDDDGDDDDEDDDDNIDIIIIHNNNNNNNNNNNKKSLSSS